MLKSLYSAFFKIMSNTLMIFVTHFFPYFELQRIQKKNMSCTNSMDNHLKIGAQNQKSMI